MSGICGEWSIQELWQRDQARFEPRSFGILGKALVQNRWIWPWHGSWCLFSVGARLHIERE